MYHKIVNEISTKNLIFATMSDTVFCRLGHFIQTKYGIKMPPSKKSLLEARLQKRLRSLRMNTFEDYCEYVFSPQGVDEIIHMIDVVTTNKTDFFREPHHFDYLVKVALPELIRLRKVGIRKRFFVWSAGCASGEEPYTLAMVLSDFAEKNDGFRFSILATDVSKQALTKAKLGIYKEDKVEPIPIRLRKKYLLKSKDKNKGLIRIVPELRELVHFRWLNFMEKHFGIHEPVDIIFCRNVIIYFNKNTQQKLLNEFYRYLSPNGYIFMGHSETLNGLNVPLMPIAPTIYRKAG